MKDISKYEKEKFCQILECSENELNLLIKNALKLIDNMCDPYDIFLKILQQGNNVREATLIGLLCGKLIGFVVAEKKIERDIKDKLFNAFKKNRPF